MSDSGRPAAIQLIAGSSAHFFSDDGSAARCTTSRRYPNSRSRHWTGFIIAHDGEVGTPRTGDVQRALPRVAGVPAADRELKQERPIRDSGIVQYPEWTCRRHACHVAGHRNTHTRTEIKTGQLISFDAGRACPGADLWGRRHLPEELTWESFLAPAGAGPRVVQSHEQELHAALRGRPSTEQP